ncbi:hypothetical protein EVAR_33715_1 [Eumeta japonica]|uniref:Uncharacterized protein n=1 Tax=Eumeta variegata TaxID=151549 RepID=A0A4C1VV26_EUMVA|nr:hypothetical protein EVAR_33715_1 [Eumeta japonica]
MSEIRSAIIVFKPEGWASLYPLVYDREWSGGVGSCDILPNGSLDCTAATLEAKQTSEVVHVDAPAAVPRRHASQSGRTCTQHAAEVVEIHDGGERLTRGKVIAQTRVSNRSYDVKVEEIAEQPGVVSVAAVVRERCISLRAQLLGESSWSCPTAPLRCILTDTAPAKLLKGFALLVLLSSARRNAIRQTGCGFGALARREDDDARESSRGIASAASFS